VLGLRRQSVEGRFDGAGIDRDKLVEKAARDKLRQSGTGRDRRRATPGLEAHLADGAVCNVGPEAKNVAADGILDLHNESGRGQLAGIPRIAEVLEQPLAVRAWHRPLDRPPAPPEENLR